MKYEPSPHVSITGIPRWALIGVPFVLVAAVVGIGFAIAAATSVEPGPSFASPTPRGTTLPAPPADLTPSAQPESPSPSPSATEGNARPTAAPSQSIAAGTVADGTSASVSGDGSAEITMVREGNIAMVVELDCSACAGPTVLTDAERMQPFVESDGAVKGGYLIDVMADTSEDQSLWLVADGPWEMTISSWNDLPPLTGAVEGTGSTVIYLDGDSASSLVTFEPADADDSFQGRYFGVAKEDTRAFGDSVAFSEQMDLQRPGVIAIKTEGAWSIEP